MRLIRLRTRRSAAEIARPACRDPSSVSWSLPVFCNESTSATHLLRRYSGPSRASAWIPPFSVNLSGLPSPRMAGTQRRVDADARGGEIASLNASGAPLCVRPPITQGVRPRSRRPPSFIDYWASATMPHGRNCGGLDIGCRKKACSCPFSTPLPTI